MVELIKKVNDNLYIIRLSNAACVVDRRTYKELCKVYVNQ